MKQIIFVADFFVEDHLGGAEINDNTLIGMLDLEGLLFEKKHSHLITETYLLENQDKLFIISNMTRLNAQLMPVLALCNYVVYEHDYKFVANRNPATYIGFAVPKNEIINEHFYKSALSVICLSKMHRDIFEKNLDLNNLTNIHCSLFDDAKLDLLLSLGENNKSKDYAIINTSNPTKRTQDVVKWCNSKNIEFDLISHPDNNEFLKILSQYKNLVFMTRHPEPTPRIAVETKLMGVNLIASKKMISVAHEYWWDWEPTKVANELKNIRNGALDMFRGFIQ